MCLANIQNRSAINESRDLSPITYQEHFVAWNIPCFGKTTHCGRLAADYLLWTTHCGRLTAESGSLTVDQSLRTTHCGQPTADYSLWTIQCGLPTVDHSLRTTNCAPLTVDDSLLTVTIYCVWLTASYSLRITYYKSLTADH